jgi:hypothetical protein
VNDQSFRFFGHDAVEWKGRYSRIPGEPYVFHVLSCGSERALVAYIKTSDGRLVCRAPSLPDVQRLIEAVDWVKRSYHGTAGGSFLINEYGQVLVPTRWGRRFCVGSVQGALCLLHPVTGTLMNLADDSRLELGDPWELPYVGMAYNLHRSSEIYYWDCEGQVPVRPAVQDRDLVRKLRKIRRTGPMRFIVNPYGIVLTNVPVGDFDFDEDRWQPVYVGRVDYNKWFAREEAAGCQGVL